MGDYKELVQRWFDEVWNRGRADVIDELLAPDALIYGLAPEPLCGPAAFKSVHNAYRTAFPDLRIHLDDVVAEEDKVAFRWTATATHSGDLAGVAGTGRVTHFTGMGVVRVCGERIVEGWNVFDQLGMLRQIGAVHTNA
jgi:steroid delta-isomerase-like uncharacterized protein